VRRGQYGGHGRRCGSHRRAVPVPDDLGPGSGELGLQRLHLLLQREDGTHATIDGVPEPKVRLVHQAVRRVGALALVHLLHTDEDY
jgi:hypothetical protein